MNKSNSHREWLFLGIAGLATATILAFILVAGKNTPIVPAWNLTETQFQNALVLHVNMNLIIWIGSVCGYIWSNNGSPFFHKLGALLTSIGAVFWIISAFSAPQASLNNYFPVYTDHYFLAGTLLILTGLTCSAMANLVALFSRQYLLNISTRSEGLMALLFLSSLLTATIIWLNLPESLDSHQYFELLAWGPGHLWMLLALQLMATLWLRLGAPVTDTFLYKVLWLVPLLSAIAGPAIAAIFDPQSESYVNSFTWLMRTSGLWVIPLTLHILAKQPIRLHLTVTLSALLYLLGTGIGMLIRADNLMVPAHYHATTGALNLVMMAYMVIQLRQDSQQFRQLLQRLVITYAFGVLMLALGLAVSGAMGGIRKVTMEAQVVSELPHIFALSMMGIGGIVAASSAFCFIGMSTGMFKKSRSIKIRARSGENLP